MNRLLFTTHAYTASETTTFTTTSSPSVGEVLHLAAEFGAWGALVLALALGMAAALGYGLTWAGAPGNWLPEVRRRAVSFRLTAIKLFQVGALLATSALVLGVFA